MRGLVAFVAGVRHTALVICVCAALAAIIAAQTAPVVTHGTVTLIFVSTTAGALRALLPALHWERPERGRT